MNQPTNSEKKLIVVLSLCDQFGRALQANRFTVPPSLQHLQTDRYLLPCQIVDGGELTIELYARLDVLDVINSPPRYVPVHRALRPSPSPFEIEDLCDADD